MTQTVWQFSENRPQESPHIEEDSKSTGKTIARVEKENRPKPRLKGRRPFFAPSKNWKGVGK